MKIKTTMKYHLTPVKMAIIKKLTNSKCQRAGGENSYFLHCQWECKFVHSLQKTVWWLLTKTKNRAIRGSNNPTPGHMNEGFPGSSVGKESGSVGKESACNEGDLGSIPELGRSPGGEYGNPLQGFLPSESPWTEESVL